MNRSFFWVIAIVLVSVAVNPTAVRAQNSADEAAIRKLVEQFFDAYQKKDLDGVMACWSTNSPLFADFKQFAQNKFAVSEETQFLNVTLTRWKIETNQAFVRLRFDRKWRSASTNQFAQQTSILNVQLVREGNNWKFWQQPNAVIQFARRLEATKTKEERAELVKDEKELVTEELLSVLTVSSIEQAREGEIDYALKLNAISFEIADALGGADAKGQCYWVRAGIFYSQSKYREALEDYQRALQLHQEAKNRLREAVTLKNIGELYQLINRYAEALTQFEASLKVVREIGDRAGEVEIHRSMGIIYRSMSKYAQSLNQFEESLKIAREIGDRAGEAEILKIIGIVYTSTGKYAEALTQLEASLKIAQELDDEAEVASTRNNIGNVYYLTGKYAEALSRFEESLKITREIGDEAVEASVLGNIGMVYQSLGEYTEALSQYEASLKAKREIGDRPGEATTRNNIGIVYRLTGKYAEALVQHEASLKIARELGDKLGEAQSLTYIAEVYRTQKLWQQAADSYQKAIPLIELIRTQTKEPSLQTSFFAQYTSPYYGLIESLLELGLSRDVIFAVSERAKARTLVELMTGAKIDILKSMTDVERQKEAELKANFIAASAQLNAVYSGPAPDQGRIGELKQQMDRARDEYANFRVKLFIAHPELQAQSAAYDPPALAQLSNSLFAEDPNLCLLSYLVGNDKTFLFVITSGRKGAPVNLNVYTLKADRDQELTADELKDRLDAFRLRYTKDSAPYKQLARDLYEVLLAPASNEMKGRSHVVIIPDGALYALPFQALIDEQGKHFIESHTVSYAPSVTALIRMIELANKKKKSDANTRPLFAMGRGTFPDQAQYRNLDLPRAEEQVKSIAHLFGVAPWIGIEATKAKAISAMGRARYVHFATHGELNEVAPMESAIVLGKSADDDGMLFARELVDMDLQAELVVLSACDTGLGQQVSGEGIMGLTWALFVAGTPTSVVTQWKVRDDSMSRLMLEFYRQMRLSGANGRPAISKVEALRRAQMSLMKDAAYKHPYHWAPVALVGDWSK